MRLLRRHREVDQAEADLDPAGEDRGDALGLHHTGQEDADAVGPIGLDAGQLDAGLLQTLLDHGDGIFDEFVQPRGGCRIGRHEPDQSVAVGHGECMRRQSFRGRRELARELLAALDVGNLQLNAAVADRKTGEGDLALAQVLVDVVAQIRDYALAQAIGVHLVDDA